MEQKILLLGNPALYQVSSAVGEDDYSGLPKIIEDLHDTLMAFRKKYGAGRAIAAPQIGVQKRILYMYIDQPVVFINPHLEFPDEEQMEVLDDCMSFPNLLVKVIRYKRCIIRYTDMEQCSCKMELEGDLSELLQHEFDHLDGILAVMRSINNHSFFWKETQ
ncbi:peptide deformylase [Anaerotignum neopropionicum]|uniref:Peptide deformylase n=1 Tax=Anaerotignum neopropionicum TaxID=36847 RepID=A0A136WGK8_9FIRM|nr:peptide deformylase [Anaerotignum neopropionicum]KXL53533.1 peptide deformylase [Anaerotignum neopropionicum]